MKCIALAGLALVIGAGLAVAPATAADDTVTIPRSKLEELERKAAELDKLQKELNRSEAEKARIRKEKEKAETEKRQLQQAKEDAETRAAQAVAAAAPAPAYVPPPLVSLAPLKAGEVVEAKELPGHYLADPRAAAERYEKERLAVRSEVAGFSKPMFVRPYKFLLKTADPGRRVVCALYPPEQYKAVYAAKNGTVLVGLTTREAEVPLFKVGQTVVVEGSCRGADAEGVHLSSCGLKSVQ